MKLERYSNSTVFVKFANLDNLFNLANIVRFTNFIWLTNLTKITNSYSSILPFHHHGSFSPNPSLLHPRYCYCKHQWCPGTVTYLPQPWQAFVNKHYLYDEVSHCLRQVVRHLINWWIPELFQRYHLYLSKGSTYFFQ